ncbi:MAG: mitochondrial fission ELM1 family protein [Candidatus Omnitrophica bacterium]|nr:mitochondrial fission ELM1 family protein [Candidatus Omnitrophota bacterium]
MGKKISIIESIAYYAIKFISSILQCLPVNIALGFGRRLGDIMFYADRKHKALSYANLNMAFAGEKTPEELRNISKTLFRNIGQNIIELFRLPLMNKKLFEKYVAIDGKENIDDALKKGKGCILLAFHFGSWEMANIFCPMYGYPYNVLVRNQTRFKKLNDLLNSYRSCNGSVIINRGTGIKSLINSLKNNEVVGMVVDQGGKDGELVPFFNRPASMSVGAIRMAMKHDVPICFSVIIRQKGPYHKIIIHKPFELQKTENTESDITHNLKSIIGLMESYTRMHPAEYVWIYKIWKYSNESNITILSDGKTGHLRQSQAIAKLTQEALKEREIASKVDVVPLTFRSASLRRRFSLMYSMFAWYFRYGRTRMLKNFLTPESYKSLIAIKTDYIVSCGSSVAALNHLLAKDQNAKSLVVLKPGLLNLSKFDRVFLPQHDIKSDEDIKENVRVLKGAPNLIDENYLKEQKELLLKRFSHLKSKVRYKIGIIIGGDSKDVYISENQIKILIRQVQEVAETLNADLLVTTSRRTSPQIDQLLHKTLKKDPRCLLLILPNRENVPEAMGGILGLSDLLIVSGDSISMVSEASNSGKKTIVFFPKTREIILKKTNKHWSFVEKLHEQGFILSTHEKNIGQSILDIVKQKINTRPLNDNKTILKAVKEII